MVSRIARISSARSFQYGTSPRRYWRVDAQVASATALSAPELGAAQPGDVDWINRLPLSTGETQFPCVCVTSCPQLQFCVLLHRRASSGCTRSNSTAGAFSCTNMAARPRPTPRMATIIQVESVGWSTPSRREGPQRSAASERTHPVGLSREISSASLVPLATQRRARRCRPSAGEMGRAAFPQNRLSFNYFSPHRSRNAGNKMAVHFMARLP
jgi:hypothetical protein